VAVPLAVTPPAPLRGLDRDGIEVELGRLGRTRVGLRGRHQAANVAVADAALDALESAGIARVSGEWRRVGYESVRWPGRLELIEVGGSRRALGSGAGRDAAGASTGSGASSGVGRDAAGASTGSGAAEASVGREVLLDGAHNPAGAATLAQALDDMAPFLRPDRPTLVLAIMADKDVDGVIRALSRATLLRAARVICTAPAGGRALPAEDLAARWRVLAGRAAEAVAEPPAALDAALSSGSGPVIVAGSLYLVGAARSILVSDPLLAPDPPLPHPEIAP
jgi:dihydrofolate synthase/folylpolyglutamate synthase